MEGWRGLTHSYSLVHTQTLRELLRRPDVEVFHKEVPYPFPHWKPQRGLLPDADEAAVNAVPPPPPGWVADVVYRTDFPHRLRQARAEGTGERLRTVVFVTSEHGYVDPRAVAGGGTVGGVLRGENSQDGPEATVIAACANWSRDGFLRSGAPAKQVVVVPIGVDTAVYKPLSPAERADARRAFGLLSKDAAEPPSGPGANDEPFTFLSIGAMTGNKNVPGLLAAFSIIAESRPNVRLVLKGNDALYPSDRFFREAVGSMPPQVQRLLMSRVRYIGREMSGAEMARLIACADAYVAPYKAEGFCMPVLEAAACGTPVICTKGGPTDDFTTGSFALHVASKLAHVGKATMVLQPELNDLTRKMLRAMDDANFRKQARDAGPKHAAAGYSWPRVVDRLLTVLRG